VYSQSKAFPFRYQFVLCVGVCGVVAVLFIYFSFLLFLLLDGLSKMSGACPESK
jgi:hypothetical protein